MLCTSEEWASGYTVSLKMREEGQLEVPCIIGHYENNFFLRENKVVTHDEGGAVVSMLGEFMPSFL